MGLGFKLKPTETENKLEAKTHAMKLVNIAKVENVN